MFLEFLRIESRWFDNIEPDLVSLSNEPAPEAGSMAATNDDAVELLKQAINQGRSLRALRIVTKTLTNGEVWALSERVQIGSDFYLRTTQPVREIIYWNGQTYLKFGGSWIQLDQSPQIVTARVPEDPFLKEPHSSENPLLSETYGFYFGSIAHLMRVEDNIADQSRLTHLTGRRSGTNEESIEQIDIWIHAETLFIDRVELERAGSRVVIEFSGFNEELNFPEIPDLPRSPF